MPSTSAKPLLWLLFSAGGMLTALFAPVFVLLFGLAIPLDLVRPPSHAYLHTLLHLRTVRLLLLALCTLALFHWAYRFYFLLRDILRVKRYDRTLILICYTSTIVGSAVAGYILLS